MSFHLSLFARQKALERGVPAKNLKMFPTSVPSWVKKQYSPKFGHAVFAIDTGDAFTFIEPTLVQQPIVISKSSSPTPVQVGPWSYNYNPQLQQIHVIDAQGQYVYMTFQITDFTSSMVMVYYLLFYFDVFICASKHFSM